MTPQLEKKVEQSIKLLRSILTDKGDIELSYSGGKDSDVILELAKMAKIPFRAIYKSTGIDPPYTIKHVLDNGGEVIRPREPFIKLLRRKGFPSRFTRFCCGVLKEYKVLDIAIHGIRRSESKQRADRSKSLRCVRCTTITRNTRCRCSCLSLIGRMKMSRSS